MKFFRMPTVALCLICFMIVNLAGCGSSGVTGGSAAGPAGASAVVSKSAVTVTGCSSSPCLSPSQIQAESLFVIVEQMFPTYFARGSSTQILQSGSDTIYYRVYANQFSTGLATYGGYLLYALAGKWYILASLDDANAGLCKGACWSNIASLEQGLTVFNTSMDGMVSDMVSFYDALEKLHTALATDDGSAQKTSEIGLLVDQLSSKSTSFLLNIEKMDQAETAIEQHTGTKAAVTKSVIFPLIGAAIAIYGLYSFGKQMKTYSDEATAARNERDQAASDLMNNTKNTEALSRLNTANKKMNTVRDKAVQELGTKVTTDLILSPVNPTTITGVILKEAGGNIFQDGLKVISSTKECSNGYTTAGCKIGVSATDKTQPAIVPSGKTTVVVGGKTVSRTVVQEKDFLPGKTMEITRTQIPVTQATTATIVSNDSNTSLPVVSPTLTLSSTKTSEDSTSILYTVSATLSSVSAPTTVSISIQNAGTGSSSKSISGNGTVSWSVTVLQQDATVTVTRNDTGVMQSLTLTGKTSVPSTTSYGSCTQVWNGFYKTCQNYTGAIFGDPTYGSTMIDSVRNSCVSYTSDTTAQWSFSGCQAGAVLTCSVDQSGSSFDSSYQKLFYGPGYSLNPGVLEQVNGYYVLQVSKEMNCP